MKILLLEDDVLLNEIIDEYLISLNYDVTSIYNGNDVEYIIYEEKFDLLLLDVNVPSFTCLELVQNIEKDNIKIPIIFMTSRNTEDAINTSFNLRCTDYIKKPFELSELVLRIENIKSEMPPFN